MSDDREEGRRMLSSGHDLATAVMNSQKLWRPALGLLETGGLSTFSHGWRRGSQALFLPEEILAVNRCQGGVS